MLTPTHKGIPNITGFSPPSPQYQGTARIKSSAKPKEEYMAKQWYLQMAAYALMVEELTGHEIEECMALVAVEGQNSFQMFNCDHRDYIEPLALLRKQYKNLYGI